MDKFQPFYKVYTSPTPLKSAAYIEFHPGEFAGFGGEREGCAPGQNPNSVFVAAEALAPFGKLLRAACPTYQGWDENRFTRSQAVKLLARLDHAAAFIEHARSLEEMRVIDLLSLRPQHGFHSLRGELRRMTTDLRGFLDLTLRRNKALWVIGP